MKVRVYRANTMQEGMDKIRRELGSDAVILQSKKVRQRGFKGFFLPKLLEITAAIDQIAASSKTNARINAMSPMLKEKDTASSEENRKEKVENELSELKNMVNKLVQRQENSIVKDDKKTSYWYRRLIDNEVEESIAQQLMSQIYDQYSGGEGLKFELMETLLLKKLAEKIRIRKVNLNNDQTLYQVFVGPTGVGKTTTLAKLAARYSLQYKKSVGLITIDTYRIGAVEQLRTYAQIAGIPIEVVMTLKDMEKAVAKFSDKEIVLVDTAGRSVKNAMQISEMGSFLDCLPTAMTFLVLSATTKSKDMAKIARGFSRVKPSQLIISKLDETDSYGGIITAIDSIDIPVTYVTNGQSVPDDIEMAQPEKLAKMILGVE